MVRAAAAEWHYMVDAELFAVTAIATSVAITFKDSGAKRPPLFFRKPCVDLALIVALFIREEFRIDPMRVNKQDCHIGHKFVRKLFVQ